jgi:hypothetical protein
MQDVGLAIQAQAGTIQNMVYLDSEYITPDFTEMSSIIFADTTDQQQYVSEFFDCDNFAIRLFGIIRGNPSTSAYPFGLIFVTTETYAHAINIFLDDDGKVWYVEPQNDRIWRANEETVYDPYFCMI